MNLNNMLVSIESIPHIDPITGLVSTYSIFTDSVTELGNLYYYKGSPYAYCFTNAAGNHGGGILVERAWKPEKSINKKHMISEGLFLSVAILHFFEEKHMYKKISEPYQIYFPYLYSDPRLQLQRISAERWSLAEDMVIYQDMYDGKSFNDKEIDKMRFKLHEFFKTNAGYMVSVNKMYQNYNYDGMNEDNTSPNNIVTSQNSKMSQPREKVQASEFVKAGDINTMHDSKYKSTSKDYNEAENVILSA
jgi:hypothetical protein